jgi:hypothetical protein
LNRGTKSVEGSQKLSFYFPILLVDETGVSEKTTDLSQVPCKRCIENTFLERDWLKVALNTMTINPSPLYIF